MKECNNMCGFVALSPSDLIYWSFTEDSAFSSESRLFPHELSIWLPRAIAGSRAFNKKTKQNETKQNKKNPPPTTTEKKQQPNNNPQKTERLFVQQ